MCDVLCKKQNSGYFGQIQLTLSFLKAYLFAIETDLVTIVNGD